MVKHHQKISSVSGGRVIKQNFLSAKGSRWFSFRMPHLFFPPARYITGKKKEKNLSSGSDFFQETITSLDRGIPKISIPLATNFRNTLLLKHTYPTLLALTYLQLNEHGCFLYNFADRVVSKKSAIYEVLR